MGSWSRAAPLALLPLLAWGCPSTDGFTGGGDASPEGAADVVVTDAPADGGADVVTGRCDPTKPFGATGAIPAIDDGQTQVGGARWSSDELSMVYTQNDSVDGGTNENLYLATRTSTTAQWNAGVAITGVNSPDNDSDGYLLDDGVTLFFSSERVLPIQLFVATRASSTQPFGAPQPVSSGNITDDILRVFFMPDGTTAYFIDSALNNFIDQAQIDRDAGIGQPLQLSNDNSDWPCVTGDGLTMLYDHVSSGEVWQTTRATTTDTFQSGVPVAELSGGAGTNTSPTWVSRDGCVVVMQSDRGGSGILQIYVAQRGK